MLHTSRLCRPLHSAARCSLSGGSLNPFARQTTQSTFVVWFVCHLSVPLSLSLCVACFVSCSLLFRSTLMLSKFSNSFWIKSLQQIHSVKGKGKYSLYCQEHVQIINTLSYTLYTISSSSFSVSLYRAVTDPRDGRRVALKKLPNVFQSLVSSKRVFRELKMLCFFKHENVSKTALHFSFTIYHFPFPVFHFLLLILRIYFHGKEYFTFNYVSHLWQQI